MRVIYAKEPGSGRKIPFALRCCQGRNPLVRIATSNSTALNRSRAAWSRMGRSWPGCEIEMEQARGAGELPHSLWCHLAWLVVTGLN